MHDPEREWRGLFRAIVLVIIIVPRPLGIERARTRNGGDWCSFHLLRIRATAFREGAVRRRPNDGLRRRPPRWWRRGIQTRNSARLRSHLAPGEGARTDLPPQRQWESTWLDRCRRTANEREWRSASVRRNCPRPRGCSRMLNLNSAIRAHHGLHGYARMSALLRIVASPHVHPPGELLFLHNGFLSVPIREIRGLNCVF